MGPAVVSIIVAALGAVLRFATNVHSTAFNIRTIGDILMIVGIFGFALAAVAWAYWDGWVFGGASQSRRTTVIGTTGEPVYGPNGYARTTYGAGYPTAAAPTAVSTVAVADPLDPTRPVATVVEEEERSVS